MEFVAFATGEKFNVNYCGNLRNILYITFVGYSFAEVVNVCSDSNRTSHIDYYYDAQDLANSFDGYTIITDATLESENEIRITLKQAEQFLPMSVNMV